MVVVKEKAAGREGRVGNGGVGRWQCKAGVAGKERSLSQIQNAIIYLFIIITGLFSFLIFTIIGLPEGHRPRYHCHDFLPLHTHYLFTLIFIGGGGVSGIQARWGDFVDPDTESADIVVCIVDVLSIIYRHYYFHYYYIFHYYFVADY